MANKEFKITEREANDMLESLSRIDRQVKMIKEGNTEVKGTGVKRLDIILEKTLLMGIVIKNELKQCDIPVVEPSADVNIVDSDIATIEALHDLLLDAHGYSLDFITLKKARELTAKMYKALY